MKEKEQELFDEIDALNQYQKLMLGKANCLRILPHYYYWADSDAFVPSENKIILASLFSEIEGQITNANHTSLDKIQDKLFLIAPDLETGNYWGDYASNVCAALLHFVNFLRLKQTNDAFLISKTCIDNTYTYALTAIYESLDTLGKSLDNRSDMVFMHERKDKFAYSFAENHRLVNNEFQNQLLLISKLKEISKYNKFDFHVPYINLYKEPKLTLNISLRFFKEYCLDNNI